MPLEINISSMSIRHYNFFFFGLIR